MRALGLCSALATIVVVISGCGSSAAKVGPSPSAPLTSANPTWAGVVGIAIIADWYEPPSNFNASTPQKTYLVQVFDAHGAAVRSVTATRRSSCLTGGYTLIYPEVSTSRTRVYYLDGDSSVRFLARDGSSGLATTIPIATNTAATAARCSATEVAVFSVSPDDKRIAVALMRPGGILLYSEDLATGGDHLNLYSGPTCEYPVGWWRDQLVLQLCGAVGFGASTGFHVASATTGLQSATVCDQYYTWGTPNAAGVLCQPNSTGNQHLVATGWDGKSRVLAGGPCNGLPGLPAALSPDGTKYASNDCSHDNYAYVYGVDGHPGPEIPRPPDFFATQAVGWLDDQHVVVYDGQGLRVADIAAGTIGGRIGTMNQAIFAGAVPSLIQ